MSATILQVDPNIKGGVGCVKYLNVIVLGQYTIFRCIGKRNKSSIKVIDNYEKVTILLNAEETEDYLSWSDEKPMYYQFFGAEDPRLFSFQNEIYLYYSMTNPKKHVYPVRSIEYVKLSDLVIANGRSLRGNFIIPDLFHKEPAQVEKNWLMLDDEMKILAIYSLKPFVLGEVVETKFTAKIEREYTCLQHLKTVHISSNAIKIINNDIIEYMFIYTQKTYPLDYDFYVGYMEAEAPYRLLRTSYDPIKIDVEHNTFYYIGGLTVANKTTLLADERDTLILSGGVDDAKMFKQEFKLADFLNSKFRTCKDEKSEFNYFIEKYQQKHAIINASPLDCDTKNNTLVYMLISLLMAAVMFLIFVKRKSFRYKYEKVEK